MPSLFLFCSFTLRMDEIKNRGYVHTHLLALISVETTKNEIVPTTIRMRILCCRRPDVCFRKVRVSILCYSKQFNDGFYKFTLKNKREKNLPSYWSAWLLQTLIVNTGRFVFTWIFRFPCTIFIFPVTNGDMCA